MTAASKLAHAAAVFNNVDWLIPAYLQIGGIFQLSSQIEIAVQTGGIDAGRRILHLALEKTYNEDYLSSMLLGLYCKTVYVRDFRTQIAEAIEASFLGLSHAAIATLIPVLEGVIRKIAQAGSRDVGRGGTRKLIDEFDHMINEEDRSPHKHDERLVMLKSLKGFFEDKLLSNTSAYSGLDEFNRHGILHGIFESYGNKINFFRGVTILDLFCFILMPLSHTSVFAPVETTDSISLANYYRALAHISGTTAVRKLLIS